MLETGSSMPPNKMIVLGDGTPDDCVIAILCYVHNGDDAAWIVKPNDYTSLAALEDIAFYVREFRRKITLFIFVVDQESLELKNLFKDVENKLNSSGIEFSSSVEGEKTGRVGIYECKLGPSIFKLLIVVNGHDSLKSAQHTIEDHLVLVGDLDLNRFAKDVWQQLDEESRDKIYRRLLNAEVASKVLPQHFAAVDLARQ